MHFGNFGHFPLKKKYTSSKGNAQLDPPVCCLPEGERQLGVLFPEPQLDPCLFSGWEENLSRSQIFAFGWDSFLGSFEGSITGHQTRQPDSLGDQEDLGVFCVPLEPPPSPRTEPQKDARFSYPLSQQLFTNNILWARLCSRVQGFIGEKSAKSLLPWAWIQTMGLCSNVSQGRGRSALWFEIRMGSDLGKQRWGLRGL